MTTAVSLDELAMRSDDECPTLTNNRYLMRPPGSAKLVSVQRMTNFLYPLEDTFNLHRNDLRNCAIGIARFDDLREMVLATRPDDKDGLDKITQQAMEFAGGKKKARQGTARHGVSEQVDTGEIPLDSIPEPMRSDIAAYRQALEDAGVEVLQVEGYILHDDLLVGGRFDRIVSFGSTPKILDIKTGSLDWGGVKIAAQLYGYGSAPWRYDPKTETCTPMPEIDLDVGLVAHVPTGQARCTLHWVDLSVGKRAFQLAAEIREVRKLKDVFEPWRPGTQLDALIERRAAIVARLETLRTTNPAALLELARNWPLDIPTLKHSQAHSAEQLSTIDTILCAIEDQYGVEFGRVDANHNATLKGASA
jgi:hypothetical protein